MQRLLGHLEGVAVPRADAALVQTGPPLPTPLLPSKRALKVLKIRPPVHRVDDLVLLVQVLAEAAPPPVPVLGPLVHLQRVAVHRLLLLLLLYDSPDEIPGEGGAGVLPALAFPPLCRPPADSAEQPGPAGVAGGAAEAVGQAQEEDEDAEDEEEEEAGVLAAGGVGGQLAHAVKPVGGGGGGGGDGAAISSHGSTNLSEVYLENVIFLFYLIILYRSTLSEEKTKI